MSETLTQRVIRRARHKGPFVSWLETMAFVDDGTRIAREIREIAQQLDDKLSVLNPDDRWTLHRQHEALERLARRYFGGRFRLPSLD